MRFLDFVSVRLAFWLVLGILIGYYWQPMLLWVIPMLIPGLVLVYVGRFIPERHSFPVFGAGVAVTAMSLGILAITTTLPKNKPTHYFHQTSTSKEQLHLKIREVLKPTEYAHRYVVDIIGVGDTSTTGRALLYLSKASQSDTLKVDNELLVYSKLETIRPPLNPYQFNYQEYMSRQGIHAQLNVASGAYLSIADAPKTIIGRAINFRESIIRNLQTYNFGSDQQAVIQALLLGKRTDISEATYNDYKNAGAVHILAVSGLHVGVLLLLFQWLLQPLERLPRGGVIKLVVLVIVLWGYAVIAGLSPSIVRAVTMFSFVAYALYLNRPSSTANIVTLSLLFILLLQPLFLFQVGFQMSYAAVFAIVWLFPKLQNFWNPKSFFLKKGWQLLSVSIAAQLGVLPISLFYFHQFPALFFVSNLIVVPFLGVILGTGVAILVLAYFQLLPDVLVLGYDKLIGGMNALIAWVAQQEAFVFKNISFDGFQLVLGYLLIFGLIYALTKATFRNLVFFLGALIGFSGYLLITALNTQEEAVILAHQTRNSLLLHKHGTTLTVMAADTLRTQRIRTDYEVAKRIRSTKVTPLLNSYILQDKRLLILDSTGMYPNGGSPAYLLLTQSPRINLDRLLEQMQPEVVLADGSNYRSYIARWAASCRKAAIPFHYTGDKGFYTFDKLRE